ncbi:hypothetical protein JD844_011859 [Phrynosoma platyrhinos]|uniref:mitogen-activated protein kinase kinase n=1 Tax=Phrynosoma platyrhinos TaxID=52577 RepID=A0ABQ7TKD8_PHRPL|nr:hypothetical protein JD844_011859 [Phrynosoma platyrhinos]
MKNYCLRALECCDEKATLQLPLANDGSSRSPSLENSPQHHTHPSRPRNMLGLPPQPPFLMHRSMEREGIRYQAEINDLENLGEIGSGTCGQVWKMRFKKTGHIIAVKTDVFIAMELMGTCAEKLKKRIQGPIPERILGKMTVAIVKALYYLKEKHGVIHRDVKPSNILLDERGQIKLCDFGISGRLVDSKAKTRSAGCAAYMAPERIDPPDPSKPDYDIRADVWSLGISLVELATGHLTKDHRKRPKYNKLLEHNFIKRYETLEVDVASWFKDVMAKTESPRTSSILSQHHLPFFTR